MRLKFSVSQSLGLILVISGFVGTNAQYEDTRCKCICPDPGIITKNGTQSNRKLYISEGGTCTCDSVVIPKVENEIKAKVEEFCARCECRYESRNTTIIKVVVILVIGIVSLLMTYMLFLMCLDPLLNKRIKATAYQEHTNEDDETTSVGRSGTSPHTLRMTLADSSQGPSSSVLNRVGNQQNKWKRQVEQQRENIYNRHTMLN